MVPSRSFCSLPEVTGIITSCWCSRRPRHVYVNRDATNQATVAEPRVTRSPSTGDECILPLQLTHLTHAHARTHAVIWWANNLRRPAAAATDQTHPHWRLVKTNLLLAPERLRDVWIERTTAPIDSIRCDNVCQSLQLHDAKVLAIVLRELSSDVVGILHKDERRIGHLSEVIQTLFSFMQEAYTTVRWVKLRTNVSSYSSTFVLVRGHPCKFMTLTTHVFFRAFFEKNQNLSCYALNITNVSADRPLGKDWSWQNRILTIPSTNKQWRRTARYSSRSPST